MSVDTKVRLRGYISPDRICCYLEGRYKDVKNKVKTKIYTVDKKDFGKYICYDDNPDYIVFESGFISFTDKAGENRMIFYYHTNINELVDLVNLYHCGDFNDDAIIMNVIETTNLSLGSFGNSIEIMKSICKQFGGWIDDDDCDDKSFYWISKE